MVSEVEGEGVTACWRAAVTGLEGGAAGADGACEGILGRDTGVRASRVSKSS